MLSLVISHTPIIKSSFHAKRWFSPGAPASSTTKTGRHDIAESGIKHNKSINPLFVYSDPEIASKLF
jgi:hypothetical protein